MAERSGGLEVEISPDAFEDLREIWFWTAEHFGLKQAAEYVSFLQTEMLNVERSELKAVPERSRYAYKNLRWRSSTHCHLAVYLLEPNPAIVTAVYHSAQDWVSKLTDAD